MDKFIRLTFQRKLLVGFALIVIFVGSLLWISNAMVKDAIEQQRALRVSTVEPLVKVNELQSLIHDLRVTELQLHAQDDYFALSAVADQLQMKLSAFDHKLAEFTRFTDREFGFDIKQIQQGWTNLSIGLRNLLKAAIANDRAAALKISRYESAPRFNSLSKDLLLLSAKIKTSSETLSTKASRVLDQQQQYFLMVSIAGLVICAAVMLLFARYLTRRIRYLQAAFSRISDGALSEKAEVGGNDELSDLALSFNIMQQKVWNRQMALNEAREDLEKRVAERTEALNSSNLLLREEISEKEKVQQELRVLSMAVSQSPVCTLITDTQGIVQYVNDAAEQVTGYTEQEILGQAVDQWMSQDGSYQELYAAFRQALAEGKEWRGELCSRRKSGDKYWEYVYLSPVTSVTGELIHLLVIKEDITERRIQQQQLMHQARYDSLTNLPNRTLAMDRLAQGIVNAKRLQQKLAVMFIDLDGFKNVNDSLGHDVGDDLLVMAASRLGNSIRESDVVARLGGDEFLIIMNHIREQDDCFPVLSKIKDSFSLPFEIAGHSLTVTPSIGLSIFPEDGEDGAILLRNADLAMYQAKESGRNTYCFFNHEIHESLRKRMQIEGLLKTALDQEEFYLLYQPIIEAESQKLVGVEALIRWDSAELGHVMPDQFIGIAEQTGQIVPIGNWVIQQACEQVAQWHKVGLEELTLSVNVSPRQIQEEELIKVISKALQHSGLPASSLVLEMTEGLLIRNPQQARKILEKLKSVGVCMAMDDFGTGYSSLSNLKNYPFDILKIDRTFIRDITDDPEDCALVSAAVSMSKGLGLSVVAEGVENANQLAILADMHCDRVQGYYFSKPLQASELLEWEENRHL